MRARAHIEVKKSSPLCSRGRRPRAGLTDAGHRGTRNPRAFSLVEVVIAVGIFAGAIVAVIGLSGPMQRKVSDIIDAEVAARLTKNIEGELKRIGFANATSLTDPGALPIIHLVATADGSRVLLANGGAPAADTSLNDATLPGIADRDRYFLIQVQRAVPHDPNTTGWLALRADVSWPYQLPQGPASATTFALKAKGGDPFFPVDPTQQQTLTYFFALNP